MSSLAVEFVLWLTDGVDGGKDECKYGTSNLPNPRLCRQVPFSCTSTDQDFGCVIANSI